MLLREIELDPRAATPNPAVESLLRQLGRQPNLDITMISGRSQEDLMTVKIGIGTTQARFRVSDPATFRNFLGKEFRSCRSSGVTE